MFCGGKLNHRIDILPERALLIAYGDYSLDFTELLNKDANCTIHQQNLRVLAIEMYKISNNLSPVFMRNMMTECHIPYNTQSMVKFEKDANGSLKCTKKSNFKLPSIKTVSCGLESIRYLGPKI